MIWEFSGYGGIVAIRDGKWKALRRGLKREKGPSPWELYDLETDRNEQNDLAKKNPKIVKQLEKRWLQTRVGEPHFALPLIENHRPSLFSHFQEAAPSFAGSSKNNRWW